MVDVNKIQLLEARFNSIKIDDPLIISKFTDRLDGYEHQFTHRNLINIDKRLIKIVFTISILGITKNKISNRKIKGEFNIEFHFHVENLNQLIKTESVKKKKKLVMNQELGVTLVSVSYATARGMIINITKGTWLSNAILPMIKPNELLSIHSL